MKKTKAFNQHQFALGPFVKCPQLEMIEALSFSGFDFAVIDMEHTPLGPRELYPLKLAAERRNLDLIVRIPMNLEMYFKWCLDLDFKYIQVPFVQTANDAKQAIALSYFSPQGERGLCRFVRAAEFSAKEKNDYIQNAIQQTKLILQIEGDKGVQNLDSILEIPNIYAIFIGPYDLSQSLGLPGQIWHQKVVEKMQEVIRKCKVKGIKLGTFTDTIEGIEHWAREQFDFIEYASDLNLFLNTTRDLNNKFST
jgi:4-hydroxy-2-oxoheptanedioate aldolase